MFHVRSLCIICLEVTTAPYNTLPLSDLWFPRTSDSVTSFPGHDGNPRLGPHTRSPMLNVRGQLVGAEPVVESATSSVENNKQSNSHYPVIAACNNNWAHSMGPLRSPLSRVVIVVDIDAQVACDSGSV